LRGTAARYEPLLSIVESSYRYLASDTPNTPLTLVSIGCILAAPIAHMFYDGLVSASGTRNYPQMVKGCYTRLGQGRSQ
jgi:hypothetical protein